MRCTYISQVSAVCEGREDLLVVLYITTITTQTHYITAFPQGKDSWRCNHQQNEVQNILCHREGPACIAYQYKVSMPGAILQLVEEYTVELDMYTVCTQCLFGFFQRLRHIAASNLEKNMLQYG